MLNRIRGRRLSARARAATIALSCVVAGAGGVAGAAVVVSGDEQQAAASQAVTTDEVPVLPVMLDDPAPQAAGLDADVRVRREAVGGPADYPGSIRTAPPAAVSAYQRAGAVMNAASKCQLDWTLLAAIARVESNHSRGEKRAHRISKAGVAKPEIVGKPLDGRGGRGRFADTDAGTLDRDRRWDAPVGALALMPTTWTSVAVDADGDGRRNPQDVDDAALGAAVFLCADGRKLGKVAQRRDALRTYHRAPGFVATVTALHRRYAEQADSVPVFDPPGGVRIPDDMPALCACPSPTTRARSGDPSPGSSGEETGDPQTGAPTKEPDRPSDPSAPVTSGPGDEPTEPSEDPSPSECPSPTDPSPDPTDPTHDPSHPPEACQTDPDPTESPTDPNTDPTSSPETTP